MSDPNNLRWKRGTWERGRDRRSFPPIAKSTTPINTHSPSSKDAGMVTRIIHQLPPKVSPKSTPEAKQLPPSQSVQESESAKKLSEDTQAGFDALKMAQLNALRNQIKSSGPPQLNNPSAKKPAPSLSSEESNKAPVEIAKGNLKRPFPASKPSNPNDTINQPLTKTRTARYEPPEFTFESPLPFEEILKRKKDIKDKNYKTEITPINIQKSQPNLIKRPSNPSIIGLDASSAEIETPLGSTSPEPTSGLNNNLAPQNEPEGINPPVKCPPPTHKKLENPMAKTPSLPLHDTTQSISDLNISISNKTGQQDIIAPSEKSNEQGLSEASNETLTPINIDSTPKIKPITFDIPSQGVANSNTTPSKAKPMTPETLPKNAIKSDPHNNISPNDNPLGPLQPPMKDESVSNCSNSTNNFGIPCDAQKISANSGISNKPQNSNLQSCVSEISQSTSSYVPSDPPKSQIQHDNQTIAKTAPSATKTTNTVAIESTNTHSSAAPSMTVATSSLLKYDKLTAILETIPSQPLWISQPSSVRNDMESFKIQELNTFSITNENFIFGALKPLKNRLDSTDPLYNFLDLKSADQINSQELRSSPWTSTLNDLEKLTLDEVSNVIDSFCDRQEDHLMNLLDKYSTTTGESLFA